MKLQSEKCKNKYLIQCLIFTILLLVLVTDQLSKNYVLSIINDKQDIIHLAPFLNITLVWNKGVTFGMFSDVPYGKMIITLFNIILTMVLFIWMIRSSEKIEKYAIAMIIGGALGNIIDRVRFGAVVDFIDLYIYSYHWYVFNIADGAICLGVMILLYLNITSNNKKLKKP